MAPIEAARAAAARYLEDQGYAREAAMVAACEGDDFAEVRIALALCGILKTEATEPRSAMRRRMAGEEC
jgi:hypothetical protein